MEGNEEHIPAESFRDTIERRLAALEAGKAADTGYQFADTRRIGADGADGEGNSLAGLVRTVQERMTQLETNLAENTKAVLQLTSVVEGQRAAIAKLENQVRALPQPQQ